MNKFLISLLCLLGSAGGGYVFFGTYHSAMAQADGGSSVAAAPPDISPPVVMHDPVADPSGFAQDVLHAYRATQYAFFVVLVLFGISRGVLYVSDKYDVPFLDRNRVYILFTTSVLGGATLSLVSLSHIDLRVVLGAVMATALLELRGRGKMGEAARAQSLYEAYATSTEWKSAVTGDPLPKWDDLTGDVGRRGWLAAAKAS